MESCDSVGLGLRARLRVETTTASALVAVRLLEVRAAPYVSATDRS